MLLKMNFMRWRLKEQMRKHTHLTLAIRHRCSYPIKHVISHLTSKKDNSMLLCRETIDEANNNIPPCFLPRNMPKSFSLQWGATYALNNCRTCCKVHLLISDQYMSLILISHHDFTHRFKVQVSPGTKLQFSVLVNNKPAERTRQVVKL